MFVAPRVAQIWFDYFCKRGIIKSWKGGSIWLFALSMAAWVQAEGAAAENYVCGIAPAHVENKPEKGYKYKYKGSKSLAYLLLS